MTRNLAKAEMNSSELSGAETADRKASPEIALYKGQIADSIKDFIVSGLEIR